MSTFGNSCFSIRNSEWFKILKVAPSSKTSCLTLRNSMNAYKKMKHFPWSLPLKWKRVLETTVTSSSSVLRRFQEMKKESDWLRCLPVMTTIKGSHDKSICKQLSIVWLFTVSNEHQEAKARLNSHRISLQTISLTSRWTHRYFQGPSYKAKHSKTYTCYQFHFRTRISNWSVWWEFFLQINSKTMFKTCT